MKNRAVVAAVVASLLFVCTLHAASTASYTWTGAGGDGKWSTPANWSPAGPPAAGSDLIFPTSASGATTNDLTPGTTFGKLTIACAYAMSGNAFSLSGGVDNPFSCGPSPTVAAPVTFAGNQSLTGFPVLFNGAVTVNGTITVTQWVEFHGAVNGSGAFAGNPDVSFFGPKFLGGGSFTGTSNTVDFFNDGSLPGLDVTAQRVYARGTLGNVQTPLLSMAPASFESDGAVAAALHTKNLTLTTGGINAYYDTTKFDILTTGHDEVFVTGAVTLSGKMDLGTVNAPVTAGQTFVIIDNDGSDPVIGTFEGKPEGSQLASGAATFTLSYHGGDGNDVTLTVNSVARTWTGAGGTPNWSNGANWSPAEAPQNGEALIFPASAGAASVVDDLPAGYSFPAITIDQSTVHISGNAFTCGRFIGQAPYPSRVTIDNNVDLLTPSEVRRIRFTGAVHLHGTAAQEFSSMDSRCEGPIDGVVSIRNSGESAYVGGGSYEGDIYGETAAEVRGSFPNAQFRVLATVSGSASAARMLAMTFSPGKPDVPDVGQFEFTSIGPVINYTADVTASSSDRLVIHGGTSIQSSGTLTVRVASGSPAAGTTFVIIDNRDAGPISGTFSGCPEGTIVNASGFQMRVSYKGGDGNDMTLTVLGAAKRWTGAAGDGRMSTAGNWDPAVTPVPGESLFFPTWSGTQSISNDLPAGTSFSTMSFASPVTFLGNAITITDSLVVPSATFYAPLRLAGTTLDGAFSFYSNVEIAGNVIMRGNYSTDFRGALNGTGTLQTASPYFYGGGSFTGTVTTSHCTLSSALPNASIVSQGDFYGGGTVSDLTAATFYAIDVSAQSFTIQRQNTPSWLPAFLVDFGAAVHGIAHAQQFHIDGPLAISIESKPLPGTVITILDNRGAQPIHGTFTDRAEGTVWTENGVTFRITYQGGDGNDATLTVLQTSMTTLTQSSSTSRLGEKFTLTATVTGPSSPTGLVSFWRESKVVKQVALAGGVATLETTDPLGTYDYVATYEGNGALGASTSLHLSHTVVRALPNVSVQRFANNVISVNLAKATGVDASPTGSVHVTGVVTANSAIENDRIMFPVDVNLLPSGTYPLAIAYSGDANYDQSATTYNLVVAPPALALFGGEVIAGETATVTLKLTRPSLGAVTVKWTTRDGSAVAGTDYVGAHSSLTFAPGSTVQTIAIPTLSRTTGVRTFFVAVEHSDVPLLASDAQVRIAPVIEGASRVTAEYARRETGPLTLDLYLPEHEDDAANSPQRPVVIAIESRDWWLPQETKPVGVREASRGYVVAIVHFRTNAEAGFPAQLNDLKDAVLWLRNHATQYGLDTSHFGIWGAGAGGHLAALLGTSGSGDTAVQAVVDWQGPTDLAAPPAPCGRLSLDAAQLLAGGSAALADPVTFISPDDPPFLIMHGGADCNVPPTHASRLADALRAAKLSPVLDIDATRGGLDDPSWRDPDVLTAVDEFLDSHLRPLGKHRGMR